MGNPNRLFVMPTDSHITEERRIEEAIAEHVQLLVAYRVGFNDSLRNQHWSDVARYCRLMRDKASEIWILDQRLQDVVDINKQYARIQEQIDRIESTRPEDTRHGTG